jgi:transposase-like protein
MAARRRYTKSEKVAAIVAAAASSTLAASEQTGVPESTLRYWMDDPKFAIYRENAREAMAEEARVVARMAWSALAAAIQSGELEGRDLVMAAGMATDKSQLLNGAATSRTEARDITGSLSDSDLIEAVRTAERLTTAGGTPEAVEDAPAE